MFKSPRDDVKVGDVFEVILAHSDTTAKLHARYYGIRDGVVELVWPKPVLRKDELEITSTNLSLFNSIGVQHIVGALGGFFSNNSAQF